MNTNKFIVGGIIAGVAYFLIGWVVWGMLLMNFMQEHSTELGKAAMRGEENMIWWAIIAANLVWGFLLSYVLVKGNVNSAGGGASTGAIVGLLTSLGIDLFNYAFMDVSDMTAMVVDILASIVVGAVVGAIVGWYLGRGKKVA